jgi:hypothetical protein
MLADVGLMPSVPPGHMMCLQQDHQTWTLKGMPRRTRLERAFQALREECSLLVDRAPCCGTCGMAHCGAEMAKPLLHAWTAVLMSSPRTAGCIACGAVMVLQHFFDASSDWRYWCPQVVWGGDLDYRLQVKLLKGAERNHFKKHPGRGAGMDGGAGRGR